jgi:hypothetical protein
MFQWHIGILNGGSVFRLDQRGRLCRSRYPWHTFLPDCWLASAASWITLQRTTTYQGKKHEHCQ